MLEQPLLMSSALLANARSLGFLMGYCPSKRHRQSKGKDKVKTTHGISPSYVQTLSQKLSHYVARCQGILRLQ